MLLATGTSRQGWSQDQAHQLLRSMPRVEVEMDLFSFIDCSNRSQSLSELFQLLVTCATEEGFGAVAYGALTHDEAIRLPEHQMPAIATNYPRHWCERYFERKYDEVDPVVRRTPMLSTPFLWDHLLITEQLSARERVVIEESRDAGLKNGISVPLFGRSGRVSVLSFASSSDDADPGRHMRHLNALAWQFHVAFADIAQPAKQAKPKIELSDRERVCLQWTAEGKSSWDIGMILNISENTVNFHIQRAMKKLGTPSRVVAVVTAIHLNLIELPGGTARPGRRRPEVVDLPT
jgi:LuxR family quorum-sensing system transcriptional regulator CciR